MRRSALLSLALAAALGAQCMTGAPAPAVPREIPLGAAVEVSHLKQDRHYRWLAAHRYDVLVPENAMKWGFTEPKQGVFDYSQGDYLVEFAERHDLEVRGHTLIWHQMYPLYVHRRDPDRKGTRDPWTPQELGAVTFRHVLDQVSHYRGRVGIWDVVNEAITEDGGYRQSLWYRVMGPQYIDLAFYYADQADPEARLFYNDYGTENWNPHTRGVYDLVAGMVARGVPIDGVGFQYHLITRDQAPSLREATSTFERFAALGLDVEVTELDVPLNWGHERPLRKRFARQGRIYRTVARACKRVEACKAVTTWGMTDRYSWLGDAAMALPFDAEYEPKPAWEHLVEVARDRKR